mmetsp:Transcript_37822/g.97841  ORF Transcript_37822/g.97841 Transcript_37822/m.97841 type:complete len:210 (-) Transcript_37822:385-1014(-)
MPSRRSAALVQDRFQQLVDVLVREVPRGQLGEGHLQGLAARVRQAAGHFPQMLVLRLVAEDHHGDVWLDLRPQHLQPRADVVEGAARGDIVHQHDRIKLAHAKRLRHRADIADHVPHLHRHRRAALAERQHALEDAGAVGGLVVPYELLRARSAEAPGQGGLANAAVTQEANARLQLLRVELGPRLVPPRVLLRRHQRRGRRLREVASF